MPKGIGASRPGAVRDGQRGSGTDGGGCPAHPSRLCPSPLQRRRPPCYVGPMASNPPSTESLALWQHHLQDEADAAFLYRVLAGAEPVPKRREIYLRLAEGEDRHTGIWRKVLAEHGLEAGVPSPSLRARLMAWTARRFGPSLPLGVLLQEGGQGGKGELDLYKETDPGAVKAAALTLAKESAEHAETLSGIAGTSGEP